MKCNHDCLNCVFDDCIDDQLTYAELKAIREEEKETKRQAEIADPNTDYKRRWQLIHQEQHREASRRYSREHRDKVRNYQAQHREEMNTASRQYYRDHLEIRNAYDRERRRRERSTA